MASAENSNVPIDKNHKSNQFRIFLASPGDVPLERKLAREAINLISNELRFSGRFDIKIIAWDQPGAEVAMEAGLTPQQAIAQGLPKPEDCDLAVIVLWSRIGTQLPKDFELKEDGSPYLSGTEWEYLNALKGFKNKQKPLAVWVYRRDGAPKIALNDPDKKAKIDQWEKLEKFFAAFINSDGTLAGGFNLYQAPDDFRQKFERHLRNMLEKVLESLPEVSESQPDKKSIAPPRWTDSPYLGLEAFTPEQAPIFFGRGQERDQLLDQFSDPQVHFVAVVGVSGSGKSSLVKAGLLPRLRAGIIGNAPWHDIIFKPGERSGNPHLALAYLLKYDLEISGLTEQEIARAMQSDPDNAIKYLMELLEKQQEAKELILVIDQFEELFTQSTTDDRKDFLVLLETIVAQPQMRVIVTMRADFYARAIEEPILARLLRQDRGTFPLDPPGISAILQMIIRPAEAAGLELQEGLAQCLLDDAGEGPGAMALIAFTLNQLYLQKQQQNTSYLSIDAYKDFGGVQGAVQKRAEAALQGLSVNIDKALSQLFSNLVEVNEQEVATRRRAPKSILQDETREVADALTDARLLVADEGKDKQATLEVSHETVLRGWERLKQWILDHAEALRTRRDLERVASEWDKSQRHGSALRTGKLLQHYLNAAEPLSKTADDYLTACKQRRTGFRIAYSILGLLLVTTLGVFFHVNKSQYPPTLAAKAMFVQLGVWPVTKPTMIEIPKGKFDMGDLSGDGYSNELPIHPVLFTKAFEMGKHEVTFDEYDLFAAATGRTKPSDEGWGRGSRPVINVTWEEAVAYATWLSRISGKKYRLPSESEWEYAARANTKTSFYWEKEAEDSAASICDYVNLQDQSLNESSFFNQSTKDAMKQQGLWNPVECNDSYVNTAPVGRFLANAFGLYDMSGNVYEWVEDCYIESYEGAPKDGSPRGKLENSNCSLRVLRGGSWIHVARNVRSANRNWLAPDTRYFNIGFRLARTL